MIILENYWNLLSSNYHHIQYKFSGNFPKYTFFIPISLQLSDIDCVVHWLNTNNQEKMKVLNHQIFSKQFDSVTVGLCVPVVCPERLYLLLRDLSTPYSPDWPPSPRASTGITPISKRTPASQQDNFFNWGNCFPNYGNRFKSKHVF